MRTFNQSDIKTLQSVIIGRDQSSEVLKRALVLADTAEVKCCLYAFMAGHLCDRARDELQQFAGRLATDTLLPTVVTKERTVEDIWY